MSDGIEYIIERLEEALELQRTTEGEIVTTPTVGYCLKCDKITVDRWTPKGCFDHPTVSSDGYEHGGIHDCLVLLRHLNGDSDD